jgi:hypothetical protein
MWFTIEPGRPMSNPRLPDLSKAVTLWRRPPEVEEHERRLLEARTAESAARLAIALARQKHAEVQQVGTDLVLNELQKYLRLSQHPDFANAIGPLDPKLILKMAEFVNKNFRLDNGQATENIAHAIRPSIDFSKFTQEERDAWKALAVKGGGGGQGE